jgi:hypothetical protein
MLLIPVTGPKQLAYSWLACALTLKLNPLILHDSASRDESSYRKNHSDCGLSSCVDLRICYAVLSFGCL